MGAGDSSTSLPSMPHSSQRGRLGWKTAAVIVVLVILAVSVGFYVVLTGPAGSPSAGSPVPGDTTTQPCGSPGVICGGSKVVSDSLVAYANGSSALTLKVQNVGHGNLITSLQVALNNTGNTVVGSADTDLKPGNLTTVSFLITPNKIQVSPGKTYTFELDAWDGATEDSGSIFTVVASQ